MNSLILSTAARILLPILVLFAIYVLWRGHNEPGGGFIGGLVAATALALLEKAQGLVAAQRVLKVEPLAIAATGLGCAIAAGIWGALAKGYVLAGVWPLLSVGPDGSKEGLPVGSILLFDTGVFLVVVGGVSAMLFALEAAALEVIDQPPDTAGTESDGTDSTGTDSAGTGPAASDHGRPEGDGANQEAG
ncbi:MAG: MnhB domain-containing protein [Pseudomonadota bacterium]